MTRKVKPLIQIEQLEPRIMLSGDGLLNIAPNPDQDTILDNPSKVVQEAELLHINEQVEEQISQELISSDTPDTNICQPIFTLLADDDNRNDEPVDADLSVDNIGSARASEVLALLSDDSSGDIESQVVITEDGGTPTYVNDGEISVEETLSIEIRGPPANEIVGFKAISTPSDNEESPINVWVFRALAGQNDLTLRPNVDDARVLELVDNTSGAVLTRHSLVETSYVMIEGLDDVDDTLTLDFNEGLLCNLDIEFNGGVGGFDSLLLAGNNSLTAGYTAIGADSGIIRLSNGSATATISFTGLEPVTVSDVTNYTFTTSGGADVITIDSPAPGQSRISGTSGGVSFESVTFFDVTNLTIYTSTNDIPGDDADSITIDNYGLVASSLLNCTIITGGGDDIVNIDNYSLVSSSLGVCPSNLF